MASWGHKAEETEAKEGCRFETTFDAMNVLHQQDKVVLAMLEECIGSEKLAKEPLTDYVRSLLTGPTGTGW